MGKEFKLVIDSSVLFVAWFSPGRLYIHDILDSLTKKVVVSYINVGVLEEIRNVSVREKVMKLFAKRNVDFESVLSLYVEACEVFEGSVDEIDVCRDAKDNKFLAFAKVVEADLVVTVDEDLLNVGEFAGIKIVRPSAAWKVISEFEV